MSQKKIYSIAIQLDNVPLASGRTQSFSNRWQQLAAEAGHNVVIVDAYDENLFSSLSGCDGFMWYFWNTPSNSDFGKRLILSIHQGMGLPTFPNWQTSWFFEDKHAQSYLLNAADVPSPKTRVFWDARKARDFAENAEYPMVVKLAFGIVSANVRLVKDRKEACYLIDRMFHDGMSYLPETLAPSRFARTSDRISNATRSILGRHLKGHYGVAPIQRGSILFQEFLPDNRFDVRVTVIGSRAFAFRRMNRPGDFRASGSGLIDWDPTQIDMRAINLSFQVAQHLNTQVLALDILQKAGELVVAEISYYYEAWAVHECPGHWQMVKSSGEIEWVEGKMRPDDAIFEDFIEALSRDTAPAGTVADEFRDFSPGQRHPKRPACA